jgi:hypothetical protein
MKKIFILVLAISLLCNAPIQAATADSDATAIRKAEDNVRAQLKDPDSVKFSDIKVYNHSPVFIRGSNEAVVCGYFNSKNELGGYVGKKRFLFFAGNTQFDLDPNEDQSPDYTGYRPYTFQQTWAIVCHNGPQKDH